MIPPFRYAAFRLLGKKSRPLSAVAQRSWIVEPAVNARRPRAIFLEGQLDRVEDVQEETTREIELSRVLGGEVHHAATVAFEIMDATIVGGSVYAGMGRLRLLNSRFLPAALKPEEEELDRAALDCTYVGNRYFGHWLLDDCPLHLLAREYAPPIGVARPAYSHEGDYLRLWGLQQRHVASVRVRSLTIFQDWGQNPGKRERLERLRAPILARAPPRPRPGVYFRRARSGASRVLTNEDAIEARLARRGFIIIDSVCTGVDEIVAACAGVRAVVGVEGSQMAHGLLGLVAPGGLVVTLQPPCRFNNLFKDMGDCLGLRYAFVVGLREPGGFRVDQDELDRTLDLAGLS